MPNTSNVEPPKPCSRRNDCQAQLRPEVPPEHVEGPVACPERSRREGRSSAVFDA